MDKGSGLLEHGNLNRAASGQLQRTTVTTPFAFSIMDPVSRNLDHEVMDSDDGKEAVADLKSQLGALQIGGGRDMLIDDYDAVDEKTDVVTIPPDDPLDEPEPEPEPDPMADDCRFP